MNLKTPPFWYRSEGSQQPLLEKLLTPFCFLYTAGYAMHQNTVHPVKADLPVLCIGNLVAGGTGKTPTALAIMGLLRKHSLARKPFFLSRGYGGGEIGPLLVDPSKHTAWDTGDEALLLAQAAPVIVSVDRAKGADLALRKGSDIVLMDDGLQHPGIKKDLKIVVINGEMGFGNEKVLPAGPLREPLESGLDKADAFILIGEDKRSALNKLPMAKPVFKAFLQAETLPPQDKSYIAFAGLGYPDKFFGFLKNDLGLNIIETIKFPDHYPYEEEDLRKLAKTAQEKNAELLTTSKDMMRLPKIEGIHIHTLPVALRFEDEDELVKFLKDRLADMLT